MYCPKCAAQNGDDARFCRVCGANLSQIPQALSGQLPAPQVVEYDRRGRRRKPPSFERGISTMFMGIGFAIVALALVLTKNWWGIFMLIPAFSMLGTGVSMVLAHKHELRAQQPFIHREQPVLRRPTTGELAPPPRSSEVVPPPSVTEGTTRILDHSEEASEQNR